MPAAFPVTTLDDSGAGSLRQAILDANATPGDDTIPIEVTGTINLAGALPDLSSNIEIQGPGANLLTVRRNSADGCRIFTVASGTTVVVSGLTMTNGAGGNSIPSFGGGIQNSGTFTLNDVTVSGNSATSGGGIDNTSIGTLTLNNATVSDNDGGNGGGIFNRGALTLNNATINDNRAHVFSGGGGILNIGTALTLNNTTVSRNFAGIDGGGGILNGSVLTLNHTTVSENVGGGIRNLGTLTTRNTILAGNTQSPTPDLSGNLGSLGHNLIGNTTGGSGFHETDLLDVDPLLGPLQDNGGPTFTHALLPGSPALDAGDNTDAPEFDQRGLPRIVAGTIDIGAFEVQIGPVASFYLFPDSGVVAAGVAFDLYIFALDDYGHVVTDYTGEVFFSSTDELAVLPASYTFQAENGGVAYLPEAVAFGTPGPQELYVFDAEFTVLGLAVYEVV